MSAPVVLESFSFPIPALGVAPSVDQLFADTAVESSTPTTSHDLAGMTRNGILFATLWTVVVAGCGSDVPAPGSEEYRETISAFYSGVAAMEVGEDRRAEAKLTYVTELVPKEPAAWANLALMALRRGELETAASAYGRSAPSGSDWQLYSVPLGAHGAPGRAHGSGADLLARSRGKRLRQPSCGLCPVGIRWRRGEGRRRAPGLASGGGAK